MNFIHKHKWAFYSLAAIIFLFVASICLHLYYSFAENRSLSLSANRLKNSLGTQFEIDFNQFDPGCTVPFCVILREQITLKDKNDNNKYIHIKLTKKLLPISFGNNSNDNLPCEKIDLAPSAKDARLCSQENNYYQYQFFYYSGTRMVRIDFRNIDRDQVTNLGQIIAREIEY